MSLPTPKEQGVRRPSMSGSSLEMENLFSHPEGLSTARSLVRSILEAANKNSTTSSDTLHIDTMLSPEFEPTMPDALKEFLAFRKPHSQNVERAGEGFNSTSPQNAEMAQRCKLLSISDNELDSNAECAAHIQISRSRLDSGPQQPYNISGLEPSILQHNSQPTITFPSPTQTHAFSPRPLLGGFAKRASISQAEPLPHDTSAAKSRSKSSPVTANIESLVQSRPKPVTATVPTKPKSAQPSQNIQSPVYSSSKPVNMPPNNKGSLEHSSEGEDRRDTHDNSKRNTPCPTSQPASTNSIFGVQLSEYETPHNNSLIQHDPPESNIHLPAIQPANVNILPMGEVGRRHIVSSNRPTQPNTMRTNVSPPIVRSSSLNSSSSLPALQPRITEVLPLQRAGDLFNSQLHRRIAPTLPPLPLKALPSQRILPSSTSPVLKSPAIFNQEAARNEGDSRPSDNPQASPQAETGSTVFSIQPPPGETGGGKSKMAPRKRKAKLDENGDPIPAKKRKVDENGDPIPTKKRKLDENGDPIPVKKRKVDPNKVAKPRAKRVVAPKEKKVKKVKEKAVLPFDVWLRILEFTPPSFLAKSRLINREIRDAVDEFTSIYKNCRHESFGFDMPPPPFNLTERQYSNLLSGSKGCLEPDCPDTKAARTHWSWGKRWCQKCWRSKIEREDRVIKLRTTHTRPVMTKLLECIPAGMHDSFMKPHDYVNLGDSADRSQAAPRLYKYYLTADIDKIMAEYDALTPAPYVEDPEHTADQKAAARQIHQDQMDKLEDTRTAWFAEKKATNDAHMIVIQKIEAGIKKRREKNAKPNAENRAARKELFTRRATEDLFEANPGMTTAFVASTIAYKQATRIFRDGGSERGWQALKPKILKEWLERDPMKDISAENDEENVESAQVSRLGSVENSGEVSENEEDDETEPAIPTNVDSTQSESEVASILADLHNHNAGPNAFTQLPQATSGSNTPNSFNNLASNNFTQGRHAMPGPSASTSFNSIGSSTFMQPRHTVAESNTLNNYNFPNLNSTSAGLNRHLSSSLQRSSQFTSSLDDTYRTIFPGSAQSGQAQMGRMSDSSFNGNALPSMTSLMNSNSGSSRNSGFPSLGQNRPTQMHMMNSHRDNNGTLGSMNAGTSTAQYPSIGMGSYQGSSFMATQNLGGTLFSLGVTPSMNHHGLMPEHRRVSVNSLLTNTSSSANDLIHQAQNHNHHQQYQVPNNYSVYRQSHGQHHRQHHG